MIYFASDMHLGNGSPEESRERERRVVEWLGEIASDATELFLVGDIFDFWYEYKRVVPRGFVRVLGALASLADRGVKIHYFAGNHDMWLRDYFAQELGATIYHRGQIFERCGRRLWVEHGDLVYNNFLRSSRMLSGFFRSRVARWLFSNLIHPDLAMRFGLAWSGHSRKSKEIAHPFRGEGDFLVQFARQHSATAEAADLYIFGHSHCAEDYPIGDGRRTIMLGHWFGMSPWAALDEEGNITLHK